MDARLFFALAGELLRRVKAADPSLTVGGAAECRSAVSRAYYSAFHAALEFLDKIGVVVSENVSSHTAATHCLANCGNAELAAAGSKLGSLATARKKADYRLRDTGAESPQVAELNVAMAGEIIATLDSHGRACSTDTARRVQLADKIVSWAQSNQNKNVSKKR